MKIFYRTIRLSCLFFLLSLVPVTAQEIIPAARFFSTVSDRYGALDDYQADMQILFGDQKMTGTVYYKTPHLLRINFTEPRDQVIVVDGEELQIYLPTQSVTMVQSVKRHNEAALTSMAAGQGLYLLSRGYSIGYLDSPSYVPLDEGSREQVVKLRLEWRSTEEAFRQIIVSVDENGYIRRMEAVTKDYQQIRYDLTNIMVNQGIPDTRFEFESPSSSYKINNFLFEPEE